MITEEKFTSHVDFSEFQSALIKRFSEWEISPVPDGFQLTVIGQNYATTVTVGTLQIYEIATENLPDLPEEVLQNLWSEYRPQYLYVGLETLYSDPEAKLSWSYSQHLKVICALIRNIKKFGANKLLLQSR